jgi:serine/threonine-protein kinase
VIHILTQIAGSLAEAHEKGLIHRDVKPSNAMLCERGGLFDVVKVLDFGLVKEIAETDGSLTQTNLLVGTPLYMAPEIISHPGQASPHSDLYALGAVGYFLITGHNVFEGASAVEICAAHLNDPPVTPSERVGQPVAGDLEGIILSCLAKQPAHRPSDAAAMRDALLSCADSGSWSQRQAQEWWRQNSATFTGVSLSDDAVPMSNTEILIDMDSRVTSGKVTGSTNTA